MSPSIDQLIPHRPPMQWINALIECTETTGRATACFGEDHFAVVNGVVLETALVECVAQTVAATLSHRSQAVGSPRGTTMGMLTAITNFRIQSSPPKDKSLQIDVRELRRFGEMLLVAGVVSCDGQIIAAGELSLYA